MYFKSNPLPSSLKEREWYWSKQVTDNMDLSEVAVDGRIIDLQNQLIFLILQIL